MRTEVFNNQQSKGNNKVKGNKGREEIKFKY